MDPLALDLERQIAAMRDWDIFRAIVDPAGAREHAGRVLQLARSWHADALVAHALLVLGGAKAFSGEIAMAEEHLLEAERLFRDIGDEWGELSAILRQNVIWGYREQIELALSRLPAILERASVLGDERLVIGILSDYGVQLRRDLQFERGFIMSIEAHERATELGDRQYRFLTKLNLIDPLIALHDYGTARLLCQNCAELIDERERIFLADVEMALGLCDAGSGDATAAIPHFQRVMSLAQDTNDTFLVALAQFECGKSWADIGETARARESFQAALDGWAQTGGLENSARVALATWWLESLVADFTRTTLATLQAVITQAQREPQILVEQLYDAAVVTAEAVGESELALRLAREGHARQRAYWQALAAYSSQRIARQLQVDQALRAVEIERQRRREAITRSERSEALLEALLQESHELKLLASLDGLTGVANRRAFDHQLVQAWDQLAADRSWLSVMLLDVDDFKAINDRYSHLVGDEVLRTIGHILLEHDQAIEMVGRYGGEEFGAILTSQTGEEAMIAAETIHRAIQQHPWALCHSDLQVTVSIGVASISHRHATSAALELIQVLNVVDELLYRAKRDGKNTIRHTILA